MEYTLVILVLASTLFSSVICDEGMAERHDFFCSDEASDEEKVEVLKCMEENVPQEVLAVWEHCVEEHFAHVKDDHIALINEFCAHAHDSDKRQCFHEKMEEFGADESHLEEVHEKFLECKDDD